MSRVYEAIQAAAAAVTAESTTSDVSNGAERWTSDERAEVDSASPLDWKFPPELPSSVAKRPMPARMSPQRAGHTHGHLPECTFEGLIRAIARDEQLLDS